MTSYCSRTKANDNASGFFHEADEAGELRPAWERGAPVNRVVQSAAAEHETLLEGQASSTSSAIG
jgi:hypothetical protein